MLKVSVVNFWPRAFDDDFLSWLLTLAIGDNWVIETRLDCSDIFFTSVFGNVRTPRDKTISVIGENVRPDFSRASFSLSQDFETWGGKNFYLPLWTYRMRFPGRKSVSNPSVENPTELDELIDPKNLTSQRSISLADWESRKFCALVASNYNPLRVNLFLELKRVGSVDGYGNLFGNPFPFPKSRLAKQYKFVLCPENSLYPGYVSEKLLDAYNMESIPIYWGGIPRLNHFHADSYLNLADCESVEDLLAKIVLLNSSFEDYKSMYGRPILKHQFDYGLPVTFLREAVLTIIKGRESLKSVQRLY